jgi:hypothetical protein
VIAWHLGARAACNLVLQIATLDGLSDGSPMVRKHGKESDFRRLESMGENGMWLAEIMTRHHTELN